LVLAARGLIRNHIAADEPPIWRILFKFGTGDVVHVRDLRRAPDPWFWLDVVVVTSARGRHDADLSEGRHELTGSGSAPSVNVSMPTPPGATNPSWHRTRKHLRSHVKVHSVPHRRPRSRHGKPATLGQARQDPQSTPPSGRAAPD